MYNSPFFARFGRYGGQVNRIATNIGGGFLIVPGLSLVLFGLAILIWPELLAYLVAGLLIVAGITLAFWGWQISQAQKHMQRQMQNGMVYREETYYRYPGTPYDRV